jgi:histidyl-tRNA synthetase
LSTFTAPKGTFEFVHDGLGSLPAVGGGGRYVGLSVQIGGPDVTGIGWALGVDRVLLALKPMTPNGGIRWSNPPRRTSSWYQSAMPHVGVPS